MPIMYPVGYSTVTVTLDELRARFTPRMHPEYDRRLFAWIEACGGNIGIGSGWRLTQPTKPGVAPEGKSFHQTQRFASGFQGYCAVDLVARNAAGFAAPHRSPRWSEVPAQGTTAATVWGLHCNVPGEPWHIQPIEIDGWQTWVNAGRPDPRAGYPIPTTLTRTVMQLTKTTLDPAKRDALRGNQDVALIQIYCNGLLGSGLVIDCDYGPKTVAAAKSAQQFAGLNPDGIIGPVSWGRFLNADGK